MYLWLGLASLLVAPSPKLHCQLVMGTLPCALVSVKFGNQDKFDAMYSLYGIKVQVGDLYVRLSNTNSSQSAYFRAGSSPQLSFYGPLKESGQDVSMIIENENLPKVYAARDHAILTLSAKPVTSGTILTVDTVEVEKVYLSSFSAFSLAAGISTH